MVNHKNICLGAVASLVLGLSGCMMDMPGSEHNMDAHHDHKAHMEAAHVNDKAMEEKAKAKPAGKSYASKDPTRKATPGPVHKAAPQIPVMQQ